MRIRDIRVIEIEEFEWRKLEKASSSILLSMCVWNNCTDDSKEKDRKNWEKRLGKGAAVRKRKGKNKIGEGDFRIIML